MSNSNLTSTQDLSLFHAWYLQPFHTLQYPSGGPSGTNCPATTAHTPTAKPHLAAKASGKLVPIPTRKITTKGKEMIVFLSVAEA